MNLIKKIPIYIILISIFISCSDEDISGIYKPKDIGLTPTIKEILPEKKGLSGVTEITITGENFSEINEENLVFFNDQKTEILTNSSTTIVVRAPKLISDSITVKIAVFGALLYSNTHQYRLTPAVEEVFDFLDEEDPYALTMDNTGNIYFSMKSFLAGRGLKKLSTDSLNYIDFAPKGGEDFYKIGRAHV